MFDTTEQICKISGTAHLRCAGPKHDQRYERQPYLSAILMHDDSQGNCGTLIHLDSRLAAHWRE